jgi:hypothetical protein
VIQSASSPGVADAPGCIRSLSNDELLSRIQMLVRRERSVTITILHHLNEIGRRRLYLDLGYSSLFDYCVRKLKYSPSAAGRRIQSARCVRRYPRVLGLLRARELSLGAVALIAPILTDETHASILARVRGRSYREVERVVSEYKPPVAFRDRVRPVRVAVTGPGPSATIQSGPEPLAPGVSVVTREPMATPESKTAAASVSAGAKQSEHATAPPSSHPSTPSAGSAMRAMRARVTFRTTSEIRFLRETTAAAPMSPTTARAASQHMRFRSIMSSRSRPAGRTSYAI